MNTIRPKRIRGPASFLGVGIVAACLHASDAQAIDGGARGLPRDQHARATVAVGTLYHAGGLRQCSGVLVAPDLVMTAAHCVRGDPARAAVLLYQGSEPVLSPIGVSSITRRAVFAGGFPQGELRARLRELSLDIAVLRLSAPVAGRVPLPLAGGRAQLPSTLRLAGVGLSSRGSGRLRTATLRPLLITETGLTIASVIGGQVCVGDSGGPVVVSTNRGPLLFGVVSAVITRQPPCGSIVAIAPAA